MNWSDWLGLGFVAGTALAQLLPVAVRLLVAKSKRLPLRRAAPLQRTLALQRSLVELDGVLFQALGCARPEARFPQ